MDLDPASSPQTMQAQGEAIGEWGRAESHAGYLSRLGEIECPVLIVNGYDDIMVPTANSVILFKTIPRAQLILYPDSGHGALFEFADLFVQHASRFLDHDDF